MAEGWQSPWKGWCQAGSSVLSPLQLSVSSRRGPGEGSVSGAARGSPHSCGMLLHVLEQAAVSDAVASQCYPLFFDIFSLQNTARAMLSWPVVSKVAFAFLHPSRDHPPPDGGGGQALPAAGVKADVRIRSRSLGIRCCVRRAPQACGHLAHMTCVNGTSRAHVCSDELHSRSSRVPSKQQSRFLTLCQLLLQSSGPGNLAPCQD